MAAGLGGMTVPDVPEASLAAPAHQGDLVGDADFREPPPGEEVDLLESYEVDCLVGRHQETTSFEVELTGPNTSPLADPSAQGGRSRIILEAGASGGNEAGATAITITDGVQTFSSSACVVAMKPAPLRVCGVGDCEGLESEDGGEVFVTFHCRDALDEKREPTDCQLRGTVRARGCARLDRAANENG